MDTTSAAILAGALIIIMLGMGLSLQAQDFKRVLYEPKAVIVGLINQLVFLPMVGWAIVSNFSMGPEIAVGILILAACPGGPTSNLISFMAKADLALSVTLTALSSLITIITIPFIVNFALLNFMEEGQMIALNIPATILQIFIIVVIPITVGMTIRRWRPAFAHRMSKPVRIASGVVLAVIIIGIIIKERSQIGTHFEQAGWVTLLLNVITMALGYITAKFLKIKNSQARSIAIESGIQNGTLAITIAVVLLNNTAFAIAPAIYSILMFFTGGLFIFIGNRQAATETT